ncbi:S24 family peptidase [Akkermansia muciniphila]|uniref:LexA family protein n=1 Tax=Akkermansia muciniphila TaxID=239935 RepID=UPI0033B28D36
MMRKDRAWLGLQCGGASKRTVDTWLSDAGTIPSKAILIIQKLMDREEQENGRGFLRVETITLQFSKAEWVIIQEYQKLHPDKSVQELAEEFVLKMTEGMKFWFSSSETIEKLPAITSSMYYTAQIIGNITAGVLEAGDIIPQDIHLYRPLKKGEYLLRVNGHSMEPVIADGSVVIMRKHASPPIPKVGTIVEYNDERGVTLKKLARHKDPETGKINYVLHPLNPTFGDIKPMDGGKISAIYIETINTYTKA